MDTRRQPSSNTFAVTYPNLAWFIEKRGWLELGVETASGDCESFVRVIDAGGASGRGNSLTRASTRLTRMLSKGSPRSAGKIGC